jgi:hypothetical protein
VISDERARELATKYRTFPILIRRIEEYARNRRAGMDVWDAAEALGRDGAKTGDRYERWYQALADELTAEPSECGAAVGSQSVADQGSASVPAVEPGAVAPATPADGVTVPAGGASGAGTPGAPTNPDPDAAYKAVLEDGDIA